MICAVALVAVIAVSCTRRSYTCVCRYTDRYGGAIVTESLVKGAETEARNACYAHGTYISSYVNSDASCYIR
ncbi:hypothetical protein GCM10023093_15800 [Nemorincola caseinilytica]|uniref:Uncharacterized protein n=2 Tax=Nemorincola caseinilytica TaxID=2054315 RepID=A0ABP8NFX4_9BACT